MAAALLRASALARARGSRAALWLSAIVLASAGCPESPARRRLDAAPATQSPEPFDSAEFVYDGSLRGGWTESGSAARDESGGGPAKIRFDNSGDWTLTRPGLAGRFGGLLFRVREPAGEGEFLEVRLGPGDGHVFPAVKLRPDHGRDIGDGWVQIVVPMSDINPRGHPFDRIVFRPFRPFGDEWVLFDKIALVKISSEPLSAYSGPGGRALRARIGCQAKPTKISPFIYGVAAGDDGWAKVRPPVRRWGGNTASRYNWETHFNNSARDWFFENHPVAAYTQFLADTAGQGALTALTVPMLGWVAKDGTSYSFPVSVFGPQKDADPWRKDAGNGISPANTPMAPGPPARTSIEAPPEWAKRWVMAIRAGDSKTGKRSVYEYILDNEPMLWNTTHRDVHPDPLGYDELLDRTIQYASAIREADPDAIIAGPAEWGWSNYSYSAKDLAGHAVKADRLAHGNTPLVEWYLKKLREHEQKTHARLLDVLDLHYYPQGPDVYGGGNGGVDRKTQLLRLRSTRSLWDSGYVDESWIKDTVRLLPRMREWVDKNYPGRGISIGEWNFGGEKDITGALATAEVLGRFAQFGVTSAFYWTSPPAGSASSFGFLAYRDFDGRGGHFLDWFLPTQSVDNLSLFASRDTEGKHLVIVALNMGPDTPLLVNVDFSSCGSVASYQAYVYSRGASGFTASNLSSGPIAAVERPFPPWSVTVLDVRLNEQRGMPPE
jgi:hypothetical protein